MPNQSSTTARYPGLQLKPRMYVEGAIARTKQTRTLSWHSLDEEEMQSDEEKGAEERSVGSGSFDEEEGQVDAALEPEEE